MKTPKYNIIYGPPGTGKTYTLMDVLTDEMVNYQPHEIAFSSFTRKGSYEGRDRAMIKFGFTEDELPYFRTIHSLAFREGGFTRDQMLTKKDYKAFSELTGCNFAGYYTEEMKHNDDKLLFYDSVLRNNPDKGHAMEPEIDTTKTEFILSSYKSYKTNELKFDFTDILERYLIDGEPLPVKIAIIDEAQDLTRLQWRVIEKMFSRCDRVYVAGDVDQALYEYSGADIAFFMGLNGDKRVLDRSYRLPANVLNYAKTFTDKMVNRIDFTYEPNEPGGQVNFYNDINEIAITKNESWLLLSRTNYNLINYHDVLSGKHLNYFRKDGTRAINKSEIKKIKMYESVRTAGREFNEEEKAVLNWQIRTVEGVPVDPWVNAFTWQESKIRHYQTVLNFGLSKNENHNTMVSTIHGVKGGEADNIILITDTTKSIHKNLLTNTDSELRCLYVAATRAKKNLHIIAPSKAYNYDSVLTYL